MKGDELVEGKDCQRNGPLLLFGRERKINRGNIIAMKVNDRFALRSLRQLAVRTPIRDSKSQEIRINLDARSDDIQVAAEHNA